MTIEVLARQLYVEAGDIEAIMRTLDAVELTDETAGEIRVILDPHAERSQPGFYGARGEDA